MPEIGSPRGRARTLKDPFALSAKHATVGLEVLAGVMGWMTVVSSVAFCEFRYIFSAVEWLGALIGGSVWISFSLCGTSKQPIYSYTYRR